MPKAMIFPERKDMRIFVVREILELIKDQDYNDNKQLFLEFGVCSGNTINHFAELIKGTRIEYIHGFDSFEGLEEDWTGMERGRPLGSYSLQGQLPKVLENVKLHKGWVQDTLPEFLNNNSGSILFAHMDMDTYTPGVFTLNKIKERLVHGSLILFDDFYGFGGWRYHDYKALLEVFNDNEYEIIAFGKNQAIIRIIKD
jgi:hypothetical protein